MERHALLASWMVCQDPKRHHGNKSGVYKHAGRQLKCATPAVPTCLGVLKQPPLVDAALWRRAQQEGNRGNQHQDRDGQAASEGKGVCCRHAQVVGRRGMLVQLLHCAEPGQCHKHLASRSMSFSRWHSASKHEGCSAVARSASSAQAPGSGTCGGSGGDVLLCSASPDAALIRRSPRDCAASTMEGSCAASPRIAAAAALWHPLARRTRRRCI